MIGGGITGAGVARDAALRGLRVALVEARDFASGTSSRSSKLVHGGMRYLAQGQWSVVREAARERKTLRRIAPHLARPLPVVIPAATRRAWLYFKTGMLIYEWLGQVAREERHESWSARRLATEEPCYRAGAVIGALVYPEYATDDARLTLANVRSAAAAGAVVVNYAAVERLLIEGGRACGAVVRDALGRTGSNLPPGGGEGSGNEGGARIRARVVVNAAGPWLDAVRRLENGTIPERLALTKGVHLVLRRERLPIQRMITMAAEDGRGVFAVPRGAFAYLGTTDTFVPGACYWPEVSAEDARYLLAAANRVFTVPEMGPGDVVSAWGGIRPLLRQEGKGPSEISRRDEILHGPAGVLSIAGGKLTSYRTMAERVVDACEQRLGRRPQKARTAEEPLPGGDLEGDVAPVIAALEKLGMTALEAERGARLYGSEATAVYGRGLGPEAEAEFAVTHEGAVTLEDYWVRRSGRARFDEEGGVASLEPAARAMGARLGWSAEERARQIESCKELRAREMRGVRGA